MKAIGGINRINCLLLLKMSRNMATQEQIEALKKDENVFELGEDTE